MQQHYEEEFKKKIVRLHLEEGRTLKSLSEEYGISKAGISILVKAYREKYETNHGSKEEYDYMKENLKLRKELEWSYVNILDTQSQTFLCSTSSQ